MLSNWPSERYRNLFVSIEVGKIVNAESVLLENGRFRNAMN